ncbi:uncharacterized protein LOC126628657 isoform X1 [Malus sylvestris]|uniref:uncharacterized protein LOC126628657 isoform X1 n=1 Tax=Malus sylvestris TaxID=3752 RepID=UPI0021ABFE1E|nr:uncharacterized protein LOC126628657 isoform X1 [Malus sylvestris]
MPSVEMRRTTRVFGMGTAKGGVDGARVLRSGRRLWPESSESKLERAHRGDEDWLKVMKSHASDSVVSLKPKRWPGSHHIRSSKQTPVVSKVPVAKKPESNELLADELMADELKQKKMYGIVYTRKRKRTTADVEKEGGSDDRMYGRRFFRRQRRKASGELDSHVGCVESIPVSHSSARVPKLACRNSLYRNSLTSRGIQKRRSSLSRRRSRNPSLVAFRKPNGALVSEIISSRKKGHPFSSVASNNKRRKSVPTSPVGNLIEDGSTMEGSARDLDSTCCSANILITEAGKCYREDGATVMLETSSSGEWLLVIKKDGLTRYTHKAEKVMRPCSKNRLTNVKTWSADNIGDNGWKLEFPNRSDWYIFKDLYKECSDRSVPSPAVKFIPVPGVHEVPGYADGHHTPFHRPDSYISMNVDELSRAVGKRDANYDMDSDDEKWLKKFNSDFVAEDELDDHVSEDNFELIVDAIEKAFYYRPYDFSDDNPAANLCPEMGRREVIEAVYGYWMNKRKQKRVSSLLRVFQAYQSKRSLLDPKPIMRKRRSFKRQPSQVGRGKQPSFLQAMAAEQDAMQEQNAVYKVEEAKAAAQRSVEFAIRKRQRAQLLMQNADLSTYKATMAFRIAEAALVLGSPDAAADYVLD